MPLTRVLRSRGTTVTIVASGELLFTPTGSIARWNRSLSNKVRGAAAQEAPANKRPRWGHYGKPLKSTMRASTDIDAATMMAHAAVGSVAPHGYYVDQGTGVYGGGGPYPAKILPPWQAGGYRFYEHTWRPGGGKSTVKPVMIKGQRGQGFLDAGLARGMRAMRIPPGVPGVGGSAIGRALSKFPEGLENFAGNTPVDAAFMAQLTEWRAERDAAWNAEREAKSRAAQARYDAKKRAAAELRDKILGDLAAEDKAKNLMAYRLSRAAAKKRARAEAARLKAQKERIAEGKRLREEKEKQTREANRLRRGNEATRREAMAFYQRIKQAYPNASIRSTTLDDGVVLYRVIYTTADGETVRQNFAYGYDV
jgi:hypothetical protein